MCWVALQNHEPLRRSLFTRFTKSGAAYRINERALTVLYLPVP